MSTVHIHIGQCGNQLSIPLWKNYSNSSDKGTEHLFKSMDGWQRSIHIDSESKVIYSLPKTFKVREKNIIVGKRGRGTNFALGYTGMTSQGDDHLIEESMEAVRKEIERCDMYCGCVVYHSLSGGTGSGLGSHLIELMRDSYPCSNILSCAVAPCASGESPLQNYNALLGLHWLQSYADSIILLPNDYYINHLNHLLQSGESSNLEMHSQLSFQDVNKTIANNLSGVFLPTNSLSTAKGLSLGQEPWELIRTLTPMPSTKFITLTQHTSKKLSWEGLTSKILQYHPRFDSAGEPTQALSATVVARGDANNTFLSTMKTTQERKIKKGLTFVDWNPYPIDYWRAKVNTIGSKESRSLTLAINSTGFLDHVNTILSRALVKLEARAYVHWYYRHGISEVREYFK